MQNEVHVCLFVYIAKTVDLENSLFLRQKLVVMKSMRFQNTTHSIVSPGDC